VRGKAIVAIQNPITLNEHEELQPDISLLRWRDDYYEQSHPRPQDVLLLIEVAESSARYDRNIKILLYARNGVPEVWLLDLPQRRLEIYHSPKQGKYTHVGHHTNGRVAASLLPEAIISIDDLFPASA
jgi:Uma2 family endonuclease